MRGQAAFAADIIWAWLKNFLPHWRPYLFVVTLPQELCLASHPAALVSVESSGSILMAILTTLESEAVNDALDWDSSTAESSVRASTYENTGTEEKSRAYSKAGVKTSMLMD